ncbi:unnamed protein product [Lota lota]
MAQDTTGCREPREESMQCESISTEDGYGYPWDTVCDELLVYFDNQTQQAAVNPVSRQYNAKAFQPKMDIATPGIQCAASFMSSSIRHYRRFFSTLHSLNKDAV